MDDRDRDLTHLFVRDLDEIPLPPRGEWRRAQPKEDPMRASRLVTAGAVIAGLAIALIIGLELNARQPTAAVPSSSPGQSLSITQASPEPRVSASATPAQAAGLPDDRFGFLIQISGGFAIRSETGSSIGQFDGYAPAVSPDGRQIAYWQDTGERSDLRLVDPARPKEPRTLLTLLATERGAGNILWSPDGTALVLPIYSRATFEGIDGGPKTAVLRTFTLSGGEPREIARLTNGRVLIPVAWDQGASTIGAAESEAGGFISAYDSIVVRPNDEIRLERTAVNARVIGVQGSPDGKRVLGIWMDENTVHIWPTTSFGTAFPVGKGGTLHGARWRPGGSGQVWWSVDNEVGWFIPQTSASAVMYGGSSPEVIGLFRPDGSAVVLRASGVGRRSTVLVDASTIRAPVEIGSDAVVGSIALR